MQAVAWADIESAELGQTRSGRPLIRIRVRGADRPSDHRHDPHALKVSTKQRDAASRFVDLVNQEVEGRRRWKRHHRK